MCLIVDSLSWGIHAGDPMWTEEVLDAEYSVVLDDDSRDAITDTDNYLLLIIRY